MPSKVLSLDLVSKMVTFNTESIEELKRLSKDISTILPAEVEEYDDYSQLLVEVKGYLLESIQISQDLDALHDIQNSINSELLQFEGQTCPICGSILDKEHLINA